jgi:hypothetical protein
MPRLIKQIFGDYRLSIAMFLTLIIVIISHELMIARAVDRQTLEVKRFGQIVNRNTNAVTEASKVFKWAGEVIEKGTAQSKMNYELLTANRENLLQVLELLFIPIENRAARLKASPNLQKLNLKDVPQLHSAQTQD